MKHILFSVLLMAITLPIASFAQPERWQQRAEYTMDIQMDVHTHRFTGTQKLTYHNNSPDALDKVFYHLYFNAFQPNSMMDVRSRTIADADPRVGSRIANLKEDEIGYHRIKSLRYNGKSINSYEVVGTILEVTLPHPVAPNSSAVFEMEFESQVPVQIRRSGRNNKEGISYSMTQWYPKMCEYDYQGWHANPYVGREFHGIWGDFDVRITIDRSFILGGSGYLQNPQEIGYGYEKAGQKVSRPAGGTLTWHFKAPNVHDFAWAADPDYTHVKYQAKDGPMMHFLYQKNEKTEHWETLPDIMDKIFTYVNKHYGKYPYKQYSFIQGGDGGMEYAMATLITGHRSLNSLVGVSVHELMHSWYHMILGTNESLHPWMDEGFTSYTEEEAVNHMRKIGALPGKYKEDPQLNSVRGYCNFSQSGYEEPMSTHADHYTRNQAYGVASYVKGGVFLHQLKYIVGKENFDKSMLTYFDTWKFKHPNPNDFIRVMEKQSGLELDWFKEYFVYTTKTIDYGIRSVRDTNGRAAITLERIGLMPMPIDLAITYTDGSKEIITIPLRIMRGHKSRELDGYAFRVAEDWPWTHPTYTLELPVNTSKIQSVVIDPSQRMADIDLENNVLEK